MQFRDLKQQYQVLKKDIDAAMVKVATDCNFISGAQVAVLEKELAEYVGVRNCVTCANGTDALSIAMMVWGIGPGDAVFVPDFTFFSSGEIVSHCGATPVFVDVNKDTYNMCPQSLEKAILKVKEQGELIPKVIIPVDLFGLPADFKSIRPIADKYGLLILEDGAQGFGGEIEGKKACSFGDIATTSFFPAKPLGCYGDGGALFTNDDELAELMRSVRVHGKGEMKYDNVRIGLNSRLDTIQAAILSVKLKAFADYEVAAVNKVADKYTELLAGAVKTPVVPQGFYSSWAQYTIQLADRKTRDRLQAALKEKGIPTMVYYPKPMHKQLAFALSDDYGFDCSATEKMCDTVLSLPMHPYLKDEEIEQVAEAVKENL
ncbi:MAG: DegT/DnrJ/EryC1/StrS family aminotransferase [Firmicutes bacterium]|nr:DegT/DnrJ/EryC1/StrS family aminotransferase [Bacillota bacterium]